MTLIEVLVALSVMTILFGVAYDTIHQSLRFHAQLQRDSQRIEDSSQLAERLTGDFALLDQLTNTAPNTLLLTLRNNSTVEYQVTTNGIIRSSSANGKQAQRQYHVGETKFTFWNESARVWSPAFSGQPPVTVQLQFPDTELIVSQEKR